MQLISYVLSWMLLRVRTERGQDLMEYALLTGLIAAALIALFATTLLSGGVNSMATHIHDCVDFDGSTTCNISLP